MPELFRDFPIRLDCEASLFLDSEWELLKVTGSGMKEQPFQAFTVPGKVLKQDSLATFPALLELTQEMRSPFLLCPSQKVRAFPHKLHFSSHVKFRFSRSLKISQPSFSLFLCNCVLLLLASLLHFSLLLQCLYQSPHHPQKRPSLVLQLERCLRLVFLPIPAGRCCLSQSKHTTASQNNCPPRSSEKKP